MSAASENLQRIALWYPRLYHMAEPGSWLSIKTHGLLSTTALLDLFEVRDNARKALESQRRPVSVTITHPRYGAAVVRDQKPMSDSALRKCLRDGLSPKDWYQLLNRFAFFWVDERRLKRLLNARAYRAKRQCIVEVNTSALLARHGSRVMLSPINSGSTVFNPQPRDRETFLPMGRYPLEAWRKKRGKRGAVVELAVDGGVPDIGTLAMRVYETGGGISDLEIL